MERNTVERAVKTERDAKSRIKRRGLEYNGNNHFRYSSGCLHGILCSLCYTYVLGSPVSLFQDRLLIRLCDSWCLQKSASWRNF